MSNSAIFFCDKNWCVIDFDTSLPAMLGTVLDRRSKVKLSELLNDSKEMDKVRVLTDLNQWPQQLRLTFKGSDGTNFEATCGIYYWPTDQKYMVTVHEIVG